MLRLDQESETFSVKGQIINILSLAGHMFSVATTKFCCSLKEAIDNL